MAKDKGSKKPSFQVKNVKGSKDWAGLDCAIRDHIFATLVSIFKQHGYNQSKPLLQGFQLTWILLKCYAIRYSGI